MAVRRTNLSICAILGIFVLALINAPPAQSETQLPTKHQFHTSPGINLPASALQVAPGFCRVELGGVMGYLSSCMRTHVQRPQLLPRECVVQASDGNRTRRLYAHTCLIENGWRQG